MSAAVPQLIMRRPPCFTPALSRLFQRKCGCGGMPGLAGECAECKRKRLMRQRTGIQSDESVVPPIVHDVLRSPGEPLDNETRWRMEERLGHDFGRVRVHNDARAGASARSLDALAYTVGTDIVFAPGEYRPATGGGLRLLAHELTHVRQQTQAGATRPDPSSSGRRTTRTSVRLSRWRRVLRRIGPRSFRMSRLPGRLSSESRIRRLAAASLEAAVPVGVGSRQQFHQPALASHA